MSQTPTKPCRCGGDCRCGKANPAVAASGERPKHPKTSFIELCNDAARYQQACSTAKELLPEAGSLGPIRLLAFLAGFMLPPVNTAGEFVAALIRSGWKAWPSGLEPPQAGDLFVITDPQTRVPTQVGIVAKASTDGAWFFAIDGTGPRQRRQVAEVDFWIKAPGG